MDHPPALDPRLRHAAVIGGGPAGLMAAEVLATNGVRVVVYDRMPSVGRKLLLAGRGGLNLTHSEPLDAFLDRYGPARPHLEAAVRAFGPAELRAWCAGLGQDPFVGTSGRVFPAELRATPLLRAWLRRLDRLGVEVRGRHTWLGWNEDGSALRLRGPLGEGRLVEADATVVALGGASWPRSGSDGAWVGPLAAAGIGVVPLHPANCGVVVGWTATFAERFAGTPLKNIAVGLGGERSRGDAMVTSTGIEGGPVYAISRALVAALSPGTGPVTVEVDLCPDVAPDRLAARLARRRPGDTTSSWLRRAGGLSPVAIGLMREATANALPDGVDEMAALVKAVPVAVEAPMPIERAISSAGGVAWDEIDATFMLRRRPGTFVAGEMVDWDAPTGGYLLQATFATGVAAAHGALGWMSRSAGNPEVAQGPVPGRSPTMPT